MQKASTELVSVLALYILKEYVCKEERVNTDSFNC